MFNCNYSQQEIKVLFSSPAPRLDYNLSEQEKELLFFLFAAVYTRAWIFLIVLCWCVKIYFIKQRFISISTVSPTSNSQNVWLSSQGLCDKMFWDCIYKWYSFSHQLFCYVNNIVYVLLSVVVITPFINDSPFTVNDSCIL